MPPAWVAGIDREVIGDGPSAVWLPPGVLALAVRADKSPINARSSRTDSLKGLEPVPIG
jgi:hypothetical protein